MLCYDVSNCDYCGKICIDYDGNLLNKENVIKRSYLTRKKHDAQKCCCISTCSGEQFYCIQKPIQMSYFGVHHDGKAQ